jgi:hypothetical protein
VTSDVARPRCASSTLRDTTPTRVGNSTAVPAAASARPSAATGSVGAAARRTAPAAAASEPARRTVRAWTAASPPAAKRVSATVPANTAGAIALTPTPECSSSWAKTALQLWCAFSLANASAPSTPRSRNGTGLHRPAGAASATAPGADPPPATPAGRVRTINPPASSETAATTTNGTASGNDAPAASPVARLPMTTRLEKTPWARVMTGRPAIFSARPATAFMATSAAPLVAPTRASPTLRLVRSAAVSASPAPTTPRAPTTTAATRSPHRSTARPTSSIAGSAPAPTNSRANPS